MVIIELAKFLGWVIVWAAVFAMGTFIVKFINKNYLKKITETFKDKKIVLDYYKKIVGFIIKKHKIFGIVAVVLVLFHFVILWKYIELSLSGVIAMILMIFTALVGIYMNYNKKANKALLIKFHKYSAILLAVAIIIHLM